MMQDFRNQLTDEYQIFNEPEILFHSLHIEPTIHMLRSYQYKEHGRFNFLQFEDIDYTLDSALLSCPVCRTLMVKTSKETIYSEIDFIPGQLIAKNHIRYIYSCFYCQRTGNKVIKRSSVPSPALKKSLASSLTIAYLIKCKYIDAVSFKDIEDNYLMSFLPVNRYIMSNWIVQFTHLYLIPLYELLRDELTGYSKILYSSIEPRILKNENRLFMSKVFIWAYETQDDDKNPIIIYSYSTNKGGYPPARFLKSYAGILTELNEVSESLRSFILENNQWVLADNFKTDSSENRYSFAIYSLIETAKANNVEPYTYLKHLLRKLPDINFKKNKETAKRLFPWFIE